MRFVGGNFFALLIVASCDFIIIWFPIEFLTQGIAGKVLLIITLSRFIGGLLTLGVPSANVYFSNANNDVYNGNRIATVNFFHVAVVFIFFVPLLLLLGNYFLNYFLPQLGFLDYVFLLFISSFRAVTLLNQSLSQSRGDFKAYNFLQLRIAILSVMMGGMALFLGFGEYWFLGFIALANLLGNVFGATSFVNAINLDLRTFKNISGFYRYGWTSYLNNLVALAIARTDLYILSLFLGTSVVPVYSVASLFGEKVSLISQSVGSVLFPHLSKKSHEFDVNTFTKSLRITLVYSIYFNILLTIFLYIILKFMFSSEYEIALLIYLLLVPGFLGRSISSLCAVALNSLNKPHLNYRISILIFFINLLLTIVLVKEHGLSGAAISTSIAHLCNVVVRVFTIRYCLPGFLVYSILPRANDWLHFTQLPLGRFKFW
jgi:O-antigen/teichoic acid export membrane protein